MSIDLTPLLFLIAIVASPFILIFGIRRLNKSTHLSMTKRRLGIAFLSVLMLPFVAFLGLLSWFVILTFPFTSSVIVHAVAPSGEEVCVIQISDIVEYTISLYAHRPGEPWTAHLIDADDGRWRSGRVEFSGDELRVYQGSRVRRTIPMSQLLRPEGSDSKQFPANYTPEQIVAAGGG